MNTFLELDGNQVYLLGEEGVASCFARRTPVFVGAAGCGRCAGEAYVDQLDVLTQGGWCSVGWAWGCRVCGEHVEPGVELRTVWSG